MSHDVEELAAEVRFAIYEHDSEYGHREEAVAALDSLLALLQQRTAERDLWKQSREIAACERDEAQELHRMLSAQTELIANERATLKARLEALVGALQTGWPKSVLVDRDGSNEEMLAFPLSAWWPVRDALETVLTDMPSDGR